MADRHSMSRLRQAFEDMPNMVLSSRQRSTLVISFVIIASLASIAIAAENHSVSQKNRAFSFNSLLVAKGDTIQFVNDDEFIHQIYVKSDNFNIDTEESPPGDTISVPFTVPGVFDVFCHIHPKMRLVVTVK